MAPFSGVPALLLLNGVVIASHTLLARQAHWVGVAPVVYALASAAGATVFLATVRVATGSRAGLRSAEMRYGLVAGLISVAVPQVLIYSASAYVSAGIASLAYAFPTPLTYVLAVVVGLERMSMARSLGVAIAFAGAVGLAASRSTALTGDAAWIGLAMLAPIAIAAGNIYRARFWPEGSTPRDLAFAMSGGGALWLGAVALFDPAASTGIAPVGYGYLLAAAALASFGNVIYFELQRRGGIVSFSQIGYAGAVLGLIGGTLVLDERYASRTWAAALVVAAGVAVSEFVKRRDARSTSPEIARKSHR